MGPGWWVASDGRWYPPEQHPSATPPPVAIPPAPARVPPAAPAPVPPLGPAPVPPPGPHVAAHPGTWVPTHPAAGVPPGPPPKKSRKGCLIGGLLFAVLVVGGGVAVVLVALNGTVVPRRGCEVLSPEDAVAVAGPDVEVVQESTLFTDSRANEPDDYRVLADENSCVLVSTSTTGATTSKGAPAKDRIRIGWLDSSDAGTRFDQEREAAKGGLEVPKAGVSGRALTVLVHFGRDVAYGDRAFCTVPQSGRSFAGVLTQRGNRLVYVAVPARTRDEEASACERAQRIADRVR